MSMPLPHNGTLLSFNEFVQLSEAINPRPTEFGTDYRNRKFEYSGHTAWTKFQHNSSMFAVAATLTSNDTAELGFGQLIRDANPDEFHPDNYTMEDQIRTEQSLMVFNKVMYILLEFLHQQPRIKHFEFGAGNSKLMTVYNRMVRNHNFLKSVEDNGFTYTGSTDGTHRFTRIA